MTVAWNLPVRIAAILTLRSIVQGSVPELRLRRNGLKTLEFTPAELKEYGIVPNTRGGIQWDTSKEDEETGFILEEGVLNILRSRLEEWNKANTMHVDVFPLAENLGIDVEN